MTLRSATLRTIAALVLFPASASSDCLTELVDRLAGQGYSVQQSVVDGLSSREMKCLFRASRGRSFEDPAAYFVPEENRRERRVASFHGKNSLPAFNLFEKHFFLSEQGVLLGYNDSFVGRLLRSPGFFVGRYGRLGPLVLDYRLDVQEQITRRDFRTWRGRSFSYLKPNEGDRVYGGLIDLMRPITEDVAIGRALRQRSSGFRPQSYFILLRMPR